MQRLTEQILAHTKGLPEGAPIAAKSLLHLGTAPRWTRHCRDWLNVAG